VITYGTTKDTKTNAKDAKKRNRATGKSPSAFVILVFFVPSWFCT